MLKIYNTLSRQKETFETLVPGKVSMYVCGPTVYDNAHVGHAMSAVVFDIIRRYLVHKGYQVVFAMNFTDVDDKIILRAAAKKIDPFTLAQSYIDQYRRNLEGLNVLPATVNPRATQEIEAIITFVSALIDKGFAYPVDGDVYFRVRNDPEYGKLSGRKLDEMMAGARIEVDNRKENPLDFALWKAAKPGEPYWDSPWGKGRPGWHIECSAMNLSHLGEQIDIHGGGNDLVFPHHENEIAQTESLTGKPFARYWVHNGMLQLGGEKMSKSLGNLVTIDEFLASHEANIFRLIILNSNYRGPLTFNEDVIAQAEKALERLRSGLRPALPSAPGAPEQAAGLMNTFVKVRQDFEAAMDDDFNTSGALAALFELVRAINQGRDSGLNAAELQVAQQSLVELAGVLGLTLPQEEAGGQAVAPFVDLLIEIRQEMRKQKLWALSDLVRDRLKDLGVILEDTKSGATWRWE